MSKLILCATVISAFVLCSVPMAAGGPPLVLNGINDRGPDLDAHAFELYGNFPSPEAVRPIVVCSGELVQAEVMAPPLTTQINVNVEAMPSSTACSFQLQRLIDGVKSGTLTVVTSGLALEIKGMIDRGITSGRRYVELYGTYPSGGTGLDSVVICAGLYVAPRIEYVSQGQINVSMPVATPASKCTFAFRRFSDGLTSPAYGELPSMKTVSMPGFGGYFWGGRSENATLFAGQEALTTTGLDAARLVITPRMRSGNPLDNYYNLNLTDLNRTCPLTAEFLPCAVRYGPYQAAISLAGLKTIVFTAYDSASSGATGQSANYVNLPWWAVPANRQAVVQEFADLTFALYKTQNGSGKRFVIASWEGDNQAYCGSFYGYYTDPIELGLPADRLELRGPGEFAIQTPPDFRATCGSITSRNDAVAAITQWFLARQAGIRAGRAAAQAAGYGDVTVADGVEFNMNSLTYSYQVGGVVLETMLRDVVPVVQPDFVLYSSYDSQFRGHMEQDLRQIQGWLAGVAPPSQLAIGETGFARHGIDTIDTFRTVETALAVQRVKLPFAILWEAYDTNAGDRVYPYGILQATGQQRKVTRILQAGLTAQAAEIAAGPDAQINAANDRGVAVQNGVAHRYYELYGQYPRGPFAGSALCDGVDTPVDVTYEGDTQINVRIPHLSWSNRYCIFRLSRGDGAHTLAFGPVVACAADNEPCF
jgi:hypothetical protein